MFQEQQFFYLQKLYKRLEILGLEAQLFNPEEEMSFHTLVVRFPLVNRKYLSQFDLQLNFIPPEENEETHLLNLQFFSSIDEDLLPKQARKMTQLILKINPILPIGQFGLISDSQELFFKHTSLIHAQSDQENNIAVVYAQMMLIVKVMNDFGDIFLSVAYGKVSVDKALTSSVYASFFQ